MRNNPWCRNSNKETNNLWANVNIQTQTCTHAHTLSLWVFLFQPSLLIFLFSYYYPSLLRVSYFNTHPPHTPGLRIASCTVVCPFTFPSTSTLQKGSESPLLLVCARGWWHSLCVHACAWDVCVYKIEYLTRRSLHILHQTPALNPTSLYTPWFDWMRWHMVLKTFLLLSINSL